MTECRRFRVTGKVQGVYFRAATRSEALRLNITGWVRNLPTEEVEVFACGETEDIETLATWLRRGPPRAKVTSVQQQSADLQEHTSFEVLYD